MCHVKPKFYEALKTFGLMCNYRAAMVLWAYDRLSYYGVTRRQRFPDMAGAAPPPGRPALPSLQKHGATRVPGAGRLYRLPLSGLRWLLYAADRDGLRKDAAATGDAGVAVTWDCQGRVHGAPRTRIGAVTETAPYSAAASSRSPERDRPDRGDARDGLRGRRTVPQRGGKKARPTLTRQIHPGAVPTSARGMGRMRMIARPSSASSRATRASSAGGCATMPTGTPAAT
jgi:hypothetical protein